MHSDERLDVVDHVVRDLVGRQVDPARLMIIGAEARDQLHHVQFGRTDTVRAASDVDIAIATDDWQTYEDVVATYTRTGSNGVRFVVADMEVDFMPFGRVEDPDGVVTPARAASR
jgi:predicted nucleotidyltransferase